MYTKRIRVIVKGVVLYSINEPFTVNTKQDLIIHSRMMSIRLSIMLDVSLAGWQWNERSLRHVEYAIEERYYAWVCIFHFTSRLLYTTLWQDVTIQGQPSSRQKVVDLFSTRSSISNALQLYSGRLYQVEYAMEAISLAGIALGVLATDGIVLAAEKKVTSKLLEQTASAEKIYKLSE